MKEWKKAGGQEKAKTLSEAPCLIFRGWVIPPATRSQPLGKTNGIMGLLFTQAQSVSDKPRDFGSASLFHELFKRDWFQRTGSVWLFSPSRKFPSPSERYFLLRVWCWLEGWKQSENGSFLCGKKKKAGVPPNYPLTLWIKKANLLHGKNVPN